MAMAKPLGHRRQVKTAPRPAQARAALGTVTRGPTASRLGACGLRPRASVSRPADCRTCRPEDLTCLEVSGSPACRFTGPVCRSL
jgi:hypothetical protein